MTTGETTSQPRPRRTRQFELALGQVVGSYRILDELGGGGMGVVYVAEHVLLGRRAAVKVLRPEHSNVPDVVQRFFSEARATTQIRHPGIVEVYDFGYTEDGNAYLVMELLEGVSLARRLDRGQSIPFAVTLVLVRRIALALQAAHDRGIVHRDVKPDNIFLVRDGDGGPVAQVKLLDFGIARLIEDNAMAQRQTNTGVVMGTPLYMSPEQCRGAGDCDLRSDLYSLGCVMFEMLAGRPPFVVESAAEMLVAHLSQPAPDVRSFAPDVPPDVAAIVGRLLAKAPGQRFDQSRSLVAAIDVSVVRHGIERRSAALATVAAPTPAGVPPVHQKQRRFAWMGVAAATLAATIAVIALALWPGGAGEELPEIAAAPSVDATPPSDAPAIDAAPPVDAPPPPPVDAPPPPRDAPRAPPRKIDAGSRPPGEPYDDDVDTPVPGE